MQLPTIKRITREDLLDAPEWVDRLLYPLNLFLNTLYSGLNHGLTFKENIQSQTQSFQLIAGAAATNNTVKFLVTLGKKPTFLLCPNAVDSTGSNVPVTVTWNYDGSNINVTAITGLSSGATYNFTALIL